MSSKEERSPRSTNRQTLTNRRNFFVSAIAGAFVYSIGSLIFKNSVLAQQDKGAAKDKAGAANTKGADAAKAKADAEKLKNDPMAKNFKYVEDAATSPERKQNPAAKDAYCCNCNLYAKAVATKTCSKPDERAKCTVITVADVRAGGWCLAHSVKS